MTERRYSRPRPRFWTLRLALMLVPFVAGVTAAFLRTGAAANLVSYWSWPEAWAVAVCIETADLAFLLRVVWLHEHERNDLVSWCGALLAMAASVAFSIMLSLVYGDRFALLASVTGQVAAGAASIGINLTTYALAREIAAYVVEHERAVLAWELAHNEWQNRHAPRSERSEPESKSERVAVKLRRPERLKAIPEWLRSNPGAHYSAIRSRFGVSESTIFDDLDELERAEIVVGAGDGTYRSNGHGGGL